VHRASFWFSGFYFNVVPYDYDFCDDWLWGSDDIVIYDDADQGSWSPAYNVALGISANVK
jgi:hypothetical protein